MKKYIAMGVCAITIAMSTAIPAFANVVRSDGGRPIAAYSNTGSAQGQASRSSVGSTHKATSDGYRMFW